MESREENKTYYWTVKGQRVEITEEVYRGILLENERVRRLARNEQRCSRTETAQRAAFGLRACSGN